MAATLSAAIAQVVRSEIAARRVDVADFARAAGLPKTTVWRKINGVSRMSIDDADVFAGALGWSLDELVTAAKELQRAGRVHEVDSDDPGEQLIAQMSPAAQVEVRAARQAARRSAQGDGRRAKSADRPA